MSNTSLGVESALVFKKEGTPGTKESMAAGSMHTDLISETLDYMPVMTDFPVVMGNRTKRGTMEYVSHHDGNGGFIFRPRSAQLDMLLELCLGTADGSGWIAIVADATDLPMFTIECDKAGQNDLILVGCKVNTATFRSSSNSPLEVEVNVLSLSGERNDGSLTAWAATQADAEKPFMHGGLVMSGSEAWLDDGNAAGNVEVRSIEFTINNNLDPDSYCNATTRRLLPVGLFEMTGTMEVPYNATTKGFWAEMIAAAKVEFVATWTDADSNTLVATFAVKLDGELPKIAGPENQWLTLNFHGIMDSSDAYCLKLESTE